MTRHRAQWLLLAGIGLSGAIGLGGAWLIDRLAAPRGPTPRRRMVAALIWGAGWTASTRGRWVAAYYQAVGALVHLDRWPPAGALALIAGWMFWALLLSAAMPATRRWRDAERARQSPGRLPPPPTTLPAQPPHLEAGGTCLGLAAGALPVVLTDEQAQTHTLAIGATGSGKTNAIAWLMGDAVARGHAVVFIDGKGSPDLLRHAQEVCRQAGRDCRPFTFAGGAHWNPLRHGDHTHQRDLLSAAQEWSHPYFQAVAERYLGVVTQVLAATGTPASLQGVTQLLGPNTKPLQMLIRRVPDADLAERLFDIVERPDEGTRSGVAGLAHRLGRLSEAQIGPWLEPARHGAPEIDLVETATTAGGPVAYFSIDALAYPTTGRLLAAMVLQDLQHVASLLLAQGNRRPVHVFIDEFSPFDVQQLLALLNRGREAGICCVLATQDLADLERTGGRTAVDQVLANTGTKLCLRVDVRQTAERLAATVGTRPSWRATQRMVGDLPTGEGTARVEEVPVLEPSVLMQLRRGEAVLMRKHPNLSVQQVRLYRAGGPTRDG